MATVPIHFDKKQKQGLTRRAPISTETPFPQKYKTRSTSTSLFLRRRKRNLLTSFGLQISPRTERSNDLT
jgi:hypothetical protein